MSRRRRFSKLNPQGLMNLAVDESESGQTGGPTVEGYSIQSVLGRGAAGIVYQAIATETNQEFAIKLLSQEHISDPLQRERILREAKVMTSLSHPNLVSINELIEEDDQVGMVMELVKGEPLRDKIRREQELPIEEAIRIIGEIGAALATVHAAGLTHRDLKPENVMLSNSGEVKVMDFGIAFSEDDAIPRLTLTGMTLGTIGYMSPEQAEGSSVDHRSDIYSLGVMLHELLTGDAPDGILEPPKLYRSEIPDDLNQAVIKALASDPAERFPAISDFTNALHPSSAKKGKGWFRSKKR